MFPRPGMACMGIPDVPSALRQNIIKPLPARRFLLESKACIDGKPWERLEAGTVSHRRWLVPTLRGINRTRASCLCREAAILGCRRSDLRYLWPALQKRIPDASATLIDLRSHIRPLPRQHVVLPDPPGAIRPDTPTWRAPRASPGLWLWCWRSRLGCPIGGVGQLRMRSLPADDAVRSPSAWTSIPAGCTGSGADSHAWALRLHHVVGSGRALAFPSPDAGGLEPFAETRRQPRFQ
jgi:hypothetical protein